MSGMVLGSMIEADRRLRDYELLVRREKRRIKNEGVWRGWEKEVGAVRKEPDDEGEGKK